MVENEKQNITLNKCETTISEVEKIIEINYKDTRLKTLLWFLFVFVDVNTFAWASYFSMYFCSMTWRPQECPESPRFFDLIVREFLIQDFTSDFQH